MSQQYSFACPGCKSEAVIPPKSINVDLNPEMREKVQDLSCFEWICPNCGRDTLVLHSCLYHDMSNEFMVWFSPEGKPENMGDFHPIAGYTLRYTQTPNDFREKINILERNLDDRAMEISKLILLLQIQRDGVDIVDLIFHDYNENTNAFTYVAIMPTGEEQYLTYPASTYQKLSNDVREILYTPSRDFIKVDLDWAKNALELLQAR